MLQNKESESFSQIQELETTINMLRQQVENQQKSISDGLERERNLTTKWSNTENILRELKDIKYDMEAINSFDQQIKFQDDTRKIEIENIKLKNELKHYKEMYHNVEMLREEKYSLETRVQEMEQLKADNLRLDLENTRLKQERLEWSGYLESNDGLDFETPKGIIYNLTKDREASRLTFEETKVLKSEINNKNEMISKLETHLNELKQINLEKDRIHRSDLVKLEILDKDKAMFRKHVDMLENQLKLYEVEEKNYMEGSYDAIKSQRLNELQGLLKELEQRLSNDGKELIHLQLQSTSGLSIPNGPYTEIASGKSIVEFLSALSEEKLSWAEDKIALQSEINTQQKTIQSNKAQLQSLYDFIERHDKDPNNLLKSMGSDNQDETSFSRIATALETDESMYELQDDDDKERKSVRILMLKNNPASTEYGIRKHRLEQLQKENEALLKQLEKYHHISKEVVEGEDVDIFSSKKRKLSVDNDSEIIQQQQTLDSDNTPFIPIESLNNVKYEVESLKKDIDKKDKRINRLNEVFEKKISDFMETVETLFGYKVTTYDDDGKIRLESTFADGRDLSFHITSLMNDHGFVKVLGRKKDDYMYHLQSTYDTFVKERHSIPGFLSAATLELLDRQTEVYNPAVTHDFMNHDYIEENPIVDSQGHELVDPNPIDLENELDEDFVAQADDSGDDDYVEYNENDESGYDGDRLRFLNDQNDIVVTEDFDGKKLNEEIWNQERSLEGYYGNENDNNNNNSFGTGNENNPISLDDEDEDEEIEEDEVDDDDEDEIEDGELDNNNNRHIKNHENGDDENDVYEIDDDDDYGQEDGEINNNEDEEMEEYSDENEDEEL
ncbi:unnamed protein product [Cunninghamella blakesleeana]